MLTDRMPVAAAGRELPQMLASIGKDPAFRYTDAGRAFLRWMDARVPVDWERFASDLPPHSVLLVSCIARRCAEEWADFAAALEDSAFPD